MQHVSSNTASLDAPGKTGQDSRRTANQDSVSAQLSGGDQDSTGGSSQEKVPFLPKPFTDLASAGLNSAMVESLILKFLQSVGLGSGRRIAQELGLPYRLMPEFLTQLQNRKIVSLANTAAAGDFDYALTDIGRARATSYIEECAYVGTAPVPFSEYLLAVAAQTITTEYPKQSDLQLAFADLLISENLFRTLGPAINSGQGMFIFGAPGNGKTSIAERVTRCFGRTVWIPRVLDIEGQIVKLFDPTCHEPVAYKAGGRFRGDAPDARWIQIKRPTIIAGGELTMDSLEIRFDPLTRISEAPSQMKSNNGVFLIDDFGRQKMDPAELLNRWIIPLERRYDYLSLANGRKICVPFDQLIIFSTNLDPSTLVDEAFLRRIPYKIQMSDPTEEQFLEIFAILAGKFGFQHVDPSSLDYLIEQHYRKIGRPFRYCHPRDLLLQVRNHCIYNDFPLALKSEYFDIAALNYFTGTTCKAA
jgi:predicted ATPase with chaperone activity